MKKDYTDITFVLDRSGSMSSIWNDVEGGLNTFVNENKKLPGEVRFTLVVFDTGHIDTVLNHVDIRSLGKVDLSQYQPRGGTPLHDAVGITINNLGSYLQNLPENQRPEKVLFAIMTDGYENQSKEFSGAKVKEMVTHQSDKYNWDFIYLGANQDSVLAGSSIGILAGNTANFVPTSGGVARGFASLSASNESYRTGKSVKGQYFKP